MGLQQIRDSYSSDKDRAQRGARELLKYIVANIKHLKNVDRSGHKQKAVMDFQRMIERREEFTPGQLNYIDGLWESVMKGANYESVNIHVDKKRKGLRCG